MNEYDCIAVILTRESRAAHADRPQPRCARILWGRIVSINFTIVPVAISEPRLAQRKDLGGTLFVLARMHSCRVIKRGTVDRSGERQRRSHDASGLRRDGG